MYRVISRLVPFIKYSYVINIDKKLDMLNGLPDCSKIFGLNRVNRTGLGNPKRRYEENIKVEDI